MAVLSLHSRLFGFAVLLSLSCSSGAFLRSDRNKVNEVVCPGPTFVTDPSGKFCVCKDPKNCPSTAKTLSPEEARKAFKEAVKWVKNGMPMGLVQDDKAKVADVVCPAPTFVAEGQFCVCKDPKNCPSTAKTLSPEEARKAFKEAVKWVKNGMPMDLVQKDEAKVADVVCPSPTFVAEGQFCVCKDPKNCPSTAKTLSPEEARKAFKEAVKWVKNGMPMDLVQKDEAKVADVVCPSPTFVAEGQFCVCKDPKNCPSTAKTLSPEEARKAFKEAVKWVKNGMPMGLVQDNKAKVEDVVCPAPTFVAEGQFCVCKDPKNCPSTAKTLSPEEARKAFKEAVKWVKNGMPMGLVQNDKAKVEDVVCPSPTFVAEGQFCVCKDPKNCPSTAKTLSPEEARKAFKEAVKWVKNGMPMGLVQDNKAKVEDVVCPSPTFVAEGQFCVCKDPKNCPSTAKTLSPEEARKAFKEAVKWVKNGMPMDLVQH